MQREWTNCSERGPLRVFVCLVILQRERPGRKKNAAKCAKKKGNVYVTVSTLESRKKTVTRNKTNMSLWESLSDKKALQKDTYLPLMLVLALALCRCCERRSWRWRLWGAFTQIATLGRAIPIAWALRVPPRAMHLQCELSVNVKKPKGVVVSNYDAMKEYTSRFESKGPLIQRSFSSKPIAAPNASSIIFLAPSGVFCWLPIL